MVDGPATLVGGGARRGLANAVYYVVDTVPREFATYAPRLVTLMVLAVSAQLLRPPAADGPEYRRGGK